MKIIRNILLAFFVVACLAYVNVIIPKPQQTEAKTYNDDTGFQAQQFPNNTNPIIKLAVTESPRCQSGSMSDVKNYTGGANFMLPTGVTGTYKVHVVWASYFCPNAQGPCMDNKELHSQDIILHPGDFIPTGSTANSHAQNSCGMIQTDMAFVAYKCTDSSASNCSQQVLAYGNLDNPGVSNATYTYCNTGHVCQAPTPTPTPTSVPTPTPTPPVHHLACQSFACVLKPGPAQPGETSCTTAADISSECTHLTCMNNSCERVPSPGQSTCTTEGSQCGQIQHKACDHNACILKPGPGPSTCQTNSDCQTPHHNVCQNQACVRVDGEGNNSCRLDSTDCQTPHLIVKKVVNNNHGGTKAASDFTLHVKNGSGDVDDSPAAGSTTGKTYTLNAGDYVVSEDALDGYHQVSISGDCDASGHVSLVNGTTKTCVIQNEDNGGGACTMPTCNTNISGCSYPYPDTNTCSCGPLVCITNTPTQNNITVNVSQSQSQQQQQQQKQEVLGASVAPAVNATQLPSTGSGAEVLLGLFGLLPIGFKLRRFV